MLIEIAVKDIALSTKNISSLKMCLKSNNGQVFDLLKSLLNAPLMEILHSLSSLMDIFTLVANELCLL